ncbi:MAG: hypothetical protein AAF519_00260, partial [Bacteroidota bacterium]
LVNFILSGTLGTHTIYNHVDRFHEVTFRHSYFRDQLVIQTLNLTTVITFKVDMVILVMIGRARVSTKPISSHSPRVRYFVDNT